MNRKYPKSLTRAGRGETEVDQQRSLLVRCPPVWVPKDLDQIEENSRDLAAIPKDVARKVCAQPEDRVGLGARHDVLHFIDDPHNLGVAQSTTPIALLAIKVTGIPPSAEDRIGSICQALKKAFIALHEGPRSGSPYQPNGARRFRVFSRNIIDRYPKKRAMFRARIQRFTVLIGRNRFAGRLLSVEAHDASISLGSASLPGKPYGNAILLRF